ncbi:hypothetical protein QAD02_013642 [Eretmocerus hayati]|uniref:Uncharacterized protein n=1 Tax=Eretmocerus hayati TaxID=131215 RepID=A0ACC2P383_9HYME|nr:hypothetical protein QAD02_013642 [Eretmocerus hayati]
MGHTAEQCGEQEESTPKEPPQPCQIYNKLGHKADRCYVSRGRDESLNEPRAVRFDRPVCQLCQGVGHSAVNCRSFLRLTLSRGPTKICYYCKNPGHRIAKCRKRLYNETQMRGNELSLPGPSGPSETQEHLRPLKPIQVNHIERELLSLE